MRNLLIVLSIGWATFSMGQSIIPLVDFNRYFKNFQDGYFRQLEFQPISEFKSGDSLVVYVDFRGNLIVYDGKDKTNVSNMEVEYKVSDKLMTWKIGETLNMWDHLGKRTLTFNVRNYWVKDDIVVFEDVRYNSVSVYFNGQIYPLYTSLGDFEAPDFIGENVVAFRDNGNFNKVFWNGRIYDIDVWHSSFNFEGGTNIIAFNDPVNGTFAVFDNGQFLDVEEFHMDTYKAGRDFVAYLNRNGDLMYYKDGSKEKLTNFGPGSWAVKDDLVVWTENSFFYAFSNGEKIQLARYIPEAYELKNNTLAFRNVMGGVSALVDGNVVEITNQMNSSYSIHGNSVLVELFNKSFILFTGGKKYTL
ncbi:MAG: hypothetical protein P8N52_00160 [Crocinitomicaceae bacterium]|nr:hypothetical protein [Crocinitomicaceae bacterium]MDG1777043.1 hypothetical protein [Crocinitomicaceae bacterium]